MTTNRLSSFGRDHIIPLWEAGVISSEVAKAWLRAPSASLLDDDELQQAYVAQGVDHDGRALPRNVHGIARFVARYGLGKLAIACYEESSYLVVRHPSMDTWLALIEEWGVGATVYSRWGNVATVNHSVGLSSEDFASLILAAQKDSARRPARAKRGEVVTPDFVDPEQPMIRVNGKVDALRPPDLIDRAVTWIKEFI